MTGQEAGMQRFRGLSDVLDLYFFEANPLTSWISSLVGVFAACRQHATMNPSLLVDPVSASQEILHPRHPKPRRARRELDIMRCHGIPKCARKRMKTSGNANELLILQTV